MRRHPGIVLYSPVRATRTANQPFRPVPVSCRDKGTAIRHAIGSPAGNPESRPRNTAIRPAHAGQKFTYVQKHHPASELESSGILRQLMARFLQEAHLNHHEIDERIREVVNYIHHHIQQPIPIDTLAELCHLSKDHFIRLFRREMHITPVRYINRKKIESAQLRLIIGNEPIAETSYYFGFETISYFNRTFKKETGMSPGEYKRKIRSMEALKNNMHLSTSPNGG